MKTNVLAFDFGASSIRLFSGTYSSSDMTISIKEVYRFENRCLDEDDILVWPLKEYKQQLKIALSKTKAAKESFSSISVDGWGTDYVWINEKGETMLPIRSYRSSPKNEIIEEVHAKMKGIEELYRINGLAFNPINSIYRIYEDIHYNKVLERGAVKLMFFPDYINYVLSKKMNWEFSIASTSGLLDCCLKNWSVAIFDKLNIPIDIVGPLSTMPHTLQALDNVFITNKNLTTTQVISGLAHDSACALFGAGLEANDCFLINGTWSLIGIISHYPFNFEELRVAGISNEGYAETDFKVLRLLTGMWILQSLRHEWLQDQCSVSYMEMAKWGSESSYPYGFDTQDERFTRQEQMEAKIRKALAEANCLEPNSKNDIIRSFQLGLIEHFAKSLNVLEAIKGKTINLIYGLGGGMQDNHFVQLIADCLQKKIIAGFTESSIVGNMLSQLLCCKAITRSQIKTIIQNSVNNKLYYPNKKQKGNE